jgi:hypothetical protein
MLIYVIFALLIMYYLLNSVMTPSNIMTYINGIEKLGGTNFTKWKSDLMLVLAIMDRDHSFRKDTPEEPVAQGDNDSTLAHRKAEYEKVKARWERSDRVTLMIMDHSIDTVIRGALPKSPKSDKDFMAKIEEHFQGSPKSNASMLMTKMMHAKYDGRGSVREHILKMIDMSNKLKDLEMPLPEPYVIHYILLSLSSIFENFKINYNGSDKKWTTAELIAKCSQEEERLRTENKDYVNLISQDLKKIFSHGQSSEKSGGKSSQFKKGKGKKSYEKRPNDHLKKEAPKVEGASEKKNGPKYLHCKDWGYIRRECTDFKAWLAKKGNNDIMSFIDEPFFTYYSLNMWWIDSGATVNVTNSSQGFLGVRTTRGERNLKVADGCEAKVEAVGTLPLVLHGGLL